MEVTEMKKWLMKQFGIIKRRNKAELEIIERVETMMNLSDDAIDNVTVIVKEALDRQFT